MPKQVGRPKSDNPNSPRGMSYRRGRILAVQQKVLGTRSRNARPQLQQLKPIHKAIIARHLEGVQSIGIAAEFKVSPLTVQYVLDCDLAKPYLDHFHALIDFDIKALAPRAVAALDDALSGGDKTLKLNAAKEALKLNNRYPKEEAPNGPTAEDLVKEVIGLARETVAGIREVKRNPNRVIDGQAREIKELESN